MRHAALITLPTAILLAIQLGVLSATQNTPARAETTTSSTPSTGPALIDLAARAGQLLVVGFPGTRLEDPGVAWAAEEIAAGRVGGVLLLQRNVESPEQLRRLLAGLRAHAPTGSLLVFIDQEGGRVARLNPRNGFGAAPSAEALGRMSEAARARAFADIAETLRFAGVDVNLAPVVDLAVEPRNRAIVGYGRSYGRDPERVGAIAAAFVLAHRAEGVRTCLKHFPGHGAAIGDPHRGVSSVAGRWNAARDLTPFVRALAAPGSAGCVMTSHLHAPSIAGADIVTFSPAALQVLRERLGFDGVAATDDLQMAAVERATVVAARDALIAGHDLLIVANFQRFEPELPTAFRNAVAAALADGMLSPDALQASLRRIADWRP